jgi:hypothetical protein
MTQKQADAAETNLDDTNVSVNNVYEQPEGRKPGTLNARWGDAPPEGANGYPDIYSKGVMRAAKDTRADMIERLFDSPGTSASPAQALMSELFENARDGHPHSPLLQRGRLPVAEHSEKDASETLTDAVMRVVGHR